MSIHLDEISDPKTFCLKLDVNKLENHRSYRQSVSQEHNNFRTRRSSEAGCVLGIYPSIETTQHFSASKISLRREELVTDSRQWQVLDARGSAAWSCFQTRACTSVDFDFCSLNDSALITIEVPWMCLEWNFEGAQVSVGGTVIVSSLCHYTSDIMLLAHWKWNTSLCTTLQFCMKIWWW